MREFLVGNTEQAQRPLPLLASLQAITHFGLGDAATARTFLESFLREPDLRAENLLTVPIVLSH